MPPAACIASPTAPRPKEPVRVMVMCCIDPGCTSARARFHRSESERGFPFWRGCDSSRLLDEEASMDGSTVFGRSSHRYDRKHSTTHTEHILGSGGLAVVDDDFIVRARTKPVNFRCRPEGRPSYPNVRSSVDCFRFTPESGPGAEGPFSSTHDPKATLRAIRHASV
jgi:hypothetical protein